MRMIDEGDFQKCVGDVLWKISSECVVFYRGVDVEKKIYYFGVTSIGGRNRVL